MPDLNMKLGIYPIQLFVSILSLLTNEFASCLYLKLTEMIPLPNRLIFDIKKIYQPTVYFLTYFIGCKLPKLSEFLDSI